MNVVSDWYRRTFADPQVVLLVLLLVGALLFVNFFGQMLAPAIAAVVIAFLLDGPAGRLREKGLSNPLAVSIVFVTFLALAVVAFFAILPPITGQLAQFFLQLPSMMASLQENAVAFSRSNPGFFDETQIGDLIARLQSELIALGPANVKALLGNLAGAISLVVYTILVPVMVFFFLKDKKLIMGWIAGYLPNHRPLVDKVWAEVVAKAGDYARGKVYEIFIVGFAAFVAFWVIDLRFAAFLALLTGLSVIIPYFGAALVTLPVALVAFFQWGISSEMLLAVLVYLGLQAVDGNILAPLLFSEVVKLHPHAIILAILIFGGLWGFWGVFFAIPLATVAHAVIKAWSEHRSLAGTAPEAADDEKRACHARAFIGLFGYIERYNHQLGRVEAFASA